MDAKLLLSYTCVSSSRSINEGLELTIPQHQSSGFSRDPFFESEKNRSARPEKTLTSLAAQISTHTWHPAGIEPKLHLPKPRLHSIVTPFSSFPQPLFLLVNEPSRQRPFKPSSTGDENRVMQNLILITACIFYSRFSFPRFFTHSVCIGRNSLLTNPADFYRLSLFCFVFQPLSARSRIYCQRTLLRNISTIWLQLKRC